MAARAYGVGSLTNLQWQTQEIRYEHRQRLVSEPRLRALLPFAVSRGLARGLPMRRARSREHGRAQRPRTRQLPLCARGHRPRVRLAVGRMRRVARVSAQGCTSIARNDVRSMRSPCERALATMSMPWMPISVA